MMVARGLLGRADLQGYCSQKGLETIVLSHENDYKMDNARQSMVCVLFIYIYINVYFKNTISST